jgi:enoyl-CoA hydratase/carnithine racemase
MSLEVSDPSDGVRLVTISRPDQLNALSIELIRRIIDATDAAERDGVRALVLTGAGRAFSAGYDIHEIAALSGAEHLVLEAERGALIERWFESPIPTVAAINGICYGGGAILATGADLRVGGPGMEFRVTAASYGGANLTWILPYLVGAGRARDLLLTARVVRGEEAAEIGLLERFVDDDDVLDEAIRLAAAIAGNPAAGTRAVKALINDGLGRSPADALSRENTTQITMLAGATEEPRFSAFLARTRGRSRDDSVQA